MQDMIRKMLDVEAQARRIVEEAQTEARKATARATDAAHNRRNETLEQARLRARQLIDDAAAQAQQEKAEELKARRAALQNSIKISPDSVAAAARQVAAAVLGLTE